MTLSLSLSLCRYSTKGYALCSLCHFKYVSWILWEITSNCGHDSKVDRLEDQLNIPVKRVVLRESFGDFLRTSFSRIMIWVSILPLTKLDKRKKKLWNVLHTVTHRERYAMSEQGDKYIINTYLFFVYLFLLFFFKKLLLRCSISQRTSFVFDVLPNYSLVAPNTQHLFMFWQTGWRVW